MKKSDDMLKSLAAQFASQGVGIYQQMKAEHQEQLYHYKGTVRELKESNKSLERRLESWNAEIKEIKKENRDLKEQLTGLEKDLINTRRWWLESEKRRKELEGEVAS